jgi:hypothetical protein
MWVEAAMNLSNKELRVMERLARAQVQKSAQSKEGSEKLHDKYAI